jgi:outer membrane protein TolC
MHGDRVLLLAIFYALLLVFSNCGYSEEPPAHPPQPLTIDGAVAFGLAHNPLLEAAQEQTRAADQVINQAQAQFYPDLEAGYSFTKFKDQPVMYVLQYGALPTSHTNLNHWGVTLTQPLFTGFSLSANLSAARIEKTISEHQREEVKLGLIRDIRHAFLGVLLTKRLVEVAQDHIEALKVQRKNAEAQFHQGLTARNDVLKADVALAEAIQDERSAVREMHLARSQLLRLLNIDYDSGVVIAEQDWESTRSPEISIEQLYEKAKRQRPEIQSIEASILQAEQRMRVERGRYYPQVAAVGSYYREGEDFLGDRNDYVNNDNGSIGIQMKWNWFEGGETYAAVREWQYRRSALQKQRQDVANQIYIQIQDALEQLAVANANIDTSKTALTQALENERITASQYKEQLVIFSEVLDAQVFVLQSRVNYFKALYGYHMAWADLEYALGGAI